jgi:hypothetical protein
VDLVAVAAFAAAGLSLVNVAVSSRLTRRSQIDQWRRDAERPSIARIATLSNDALHFWEESATVRSRWVASIQVGHDPTAKGGLRRDFEAAWNAGVADFDQLKFEVFQLDLVAGRSVRSVASQLIAKHEDLRHWLRPASPLDDPIALWLSKRGGVTQIQDDLIQAARKDLGIDSARRVPLRGRTPHWRLQR